MTLKTPSRPIKSPLSGSIIAQGRKEFGVFVFYNVNFCFMKNSPAGIDLLRIVE
jgi:hypothetical protein